MENEQEQQEDVQTNEAEALRWESDQLRYDLEAREVKIAGLEKALAEKELEMAMLQQAADEAKQASDRISGELFKTVTAYKELVGQANPVPVADMLKGVTIAEINESLKNARALVEKVRQEIGVETARVRVPAGAPMRTMPDLSSLTAREKIKYGIEGG
jgi:chromosome segregation ATPase